MGGEEPVLAPLAIGGQRGRAAAAGQQGRDAGLVQGEILARIGPERAGAIRLAQVVARLGRGPAAPAARECQHRQQPGQDTPGAEAHGQATRSESSPTTVA